MAAPTVSLVLGSGGARGLAHIGVIRWLEANGFEIRSISGASMGALVGGIYAAGKLGDYTEWVRSISKTDILRLLDFSLSPEGLVKGDRIIDTLRAMTGDRTIESLAIRYTAVATDITQEKELWITQGPLFDAIRASISIPMLFTPYRLNGRLLIDGGVLNPVPIAPTFQDFTDITIAVNLSGDEDPELDLESYRTDGGTQNRSWHRRLSAFIEGLAPVEAIQKHFEWSVYDIAWHSFDMMQGTIARQKLAAYPPDWVVEIPRNACSMLEFDRAEPLIALGWHKAEEQLGTLLKKRE